MRLISRLRKRLWKRDKNRPGFEGVNGFAMVQREDAFVEVVNSLFRLDENTMKWHVIYPKISMRQMRRLHKKIVGSTEIQV